MNTDHVNTPADSGEASTVVAAETAVSVSGLVGRELDALIAERVMGWTSVHYDGPTDRARYKWLGIPPDGRTYQTEVRYFSTDIAAAMEVVERLREQGYGVVMADNMGKPPWNVDVVATAKVYEGDADSLPLAICRAALQATKTGVAPATT